MPGDTHNPQDVQQAVERLRIAALKSATEDDTRTFVNQDADALVSELERLQGELADWKAKAEQGWQGLVQCGDKLRRTNDALTAAEADIERLREALRRISRLLRVERTEGGERRIQTGSLETACEIASSTLIPLVARAALTPVSPPLRREPQPSDGPDYHAEHAFWRERQRPASPPLTEPDAPTCPECGGARDRDHCIEPGKRIGRIGCGWWKLADEALTETDG